MPSGCGHNGPCCMIRKKEAVCAFLTYRIKCVPYWTSAWYLTCSWKVPIYFVEIWNLEWKNDKKMNLGSALLKKYCCIKDVISNLKSNQILSLQTDDTICEVSQNFQSVVYFLSDFYSQNILKKINRSDFK